jgi:hypothetical protein
VFEPFHVDPFSTECNVLQLKACALFVARGTAKLDLAARAKNPMPWQLINRAQPQKSGNGSMVLRVASRGSDSTVRAYFADWNRQDHTTECMVTLLVLLKRAAKKRALTSFS